MLAHYDGSMAPEFLSGLMEYDWPGNVRELHNIVERLVVLSGELTVLHDVHAYCEP